MVTRVSSRLLLVLVSVVGIGLAARSQAVAAPDLNVDVPIIDLAQDNPCNGEPVVLNGTMHMMFHETVSSSGHILIDSMDNTSNLHGQGTFSTYTESQTDHFV